jgi:hypothetical protein
MSFDTVELKAALVGKIADFVSWPADAGLEDPYRPFELVVLGETPLYAKIRAFYDRVRIAGHRVYVRQARELRDVDRPHLLFVSSRFDERLDDVLAKMQGVPVLLVGDTEGFAGRGVAVNLVVSDDRVNFEVSRRALERHRLKASFRMLELARLIDDQQARR